MNKLFLFLSAVLISVSAQASYTLDTLMYAFFDKNGDEIGSNGRYAIVAYTSDVSISTFSLSLGDNFQSSSWLNSDASTGIYVLSTDLFFDSQIVDAIVVDNSNLPTQLTGAENLAIIAWQADDWDYSSSIVDQGDTYLIYAPTMSSGDTGVTTDPWTLVPSNTGVYNINLITMSDGGTLPNSYTTLSNVVVPEPAELATVFGVAALALAVYRRRK